MRCPATIAIVAVCTVVLPLRVSAQKLAWPKASDGYDITKPPDFGQPAPPGYEGRTDGSTQTAVGNTAATKGKIFVAHFTIGNEIKICPAADGTSEGDGVFSASFDYTDTTTKAAIHVQMRAIATYKGKVGDDALLDGPVTAEIDYTFTQTGSWGTRQGPKLSAAAIEDAQHVTIAFRVAKGEPMPTLDAFSGGDPAQGHLTQAFDAGTALAFWGGVFYSVAETRWTQENTCAQIAFDPPSNTSQPLPGSNVKVNAQVKSKAGGIAKASFSDAMAFTGGGSVSGGGTSDVGSPAVFTYTAPNGKVEKMGFAVSAVSRAGAARGEWLTGLGTHWSGQVTSSRVVEGDEGSNELQTWSFADAVSVTASFKDGKGTAVGYAEQSSTSINRQKALRNGSMTTIVNSNDNSHGSAGGTAPATVDVLENKANGTYFVTLNIGNFPPGTMHSASCAGGQCNSSDGPFGVSGAFSAPLSGKLDDPNHVHGSQTVVTPNLGRSGRGKSTVTLTWDLARSGTSQ